jgi:hypothetical protein
MTPFADIFRPAYYKFCLKDGTPPTHVLIGPKELQLFEEETQRERFQISDPACTKRMYAEVEILTTYDKESILHFFTLT